MSREHEKTWAGQTNRIFLAGLWLQTARTGNTYMSGRVNDRMKLLVFKSNKAAGSTAPDFNAYLVSCAPRHTTQAEFPQQLLVDVPPPLDPPEKT